MKNKIIVLFLFALLIPIHFSSAYFLLPNSTDLGGTANPINIQIQPNPVHIQIDQDPIQAWNNAWDKLRSIQYVPACASKYKTIKSHSALGVNMADPFSVKTETNYLDYLYSSYQICVNSAAQAENKIQKSETLCNGKYWNACPTGENFVCPSTGNAYCETSKTNDQMCTDNYGANVTFKEFDTTDGGRICTCKTGYIWNEQGTSCIVAPITKTNDQVCQDNYGPKSNWDGTKNNAGGLNCICQIGYQFNQEQTQCISIPKIKATISTTKKTSDVKTIQKEVKMDVPSINTNLSLENLNQEVTTNTTIGSKPKSLWSKLKGLLGF